MRRRRLVLAAAVGLASLVAAIAPAAHATPPPQPPGTAHGLTPHQKQIAGQLLRIADEQMMHGKTHGTLIARDGKLPTPAFSGFAGYAAQKSGTANFTVANTTFGVPRMDCNNSSYGTSNQDIIFQWSGIGGAFGPTVQQDGLVTVCTKGQSAATRNAWYFICCVQGGPNFVTVPLTGLSVGDSLEAKVCSPGVCDNTSQYYFKVSDLSESPVTSWVRNQFCPASLSPCDRGSAEGIMELGTKGADTVPSAWQNPIFTWDHANGWTNAVIKNTAVTGTLDPLAGQWTQNRFNMTDSAGTVLTQVGTLMGGTSFSTTFKNCC
ncbi:MAG TPA: hypothetical protein VF940_33625 [Streptosporangiaceae bacterium]